ncbi:MAG: hypothetical protein JO199_07665 [Candidatus Eremiobacteraeota bacterium]|nr:hypothetical protein [Candidatus Eremiobacteraeota bacterium]
MGIVAIVAGAALDGALTAIRGAAGDPASTALQQAVARELRIALDVLKYDDATIAPASIATTVPMSVGTPFPAQLSIAVAGRAGGALRVTVDAAALDGSKRRASLSATLDNRSVLPGSQVVAPQLAPAPTGAP